METQFIQDGELLHRQLQVMGTTRLVGCDMSQSQPDQPLAVFRLVGTHEVFFPNLDAVVPKNVVRGCNVKEKLWHAVFQRIVFNS